MIAVDGGTTATYSYDAMGRRFATNVGGTQQEFLFDLANRVLAMQNAATHSWDRGEIYAGGMHLATYAGQDTYFVHANWLGTVQGRTSSQGAIAQTYTSLPFGDALSQMGISPAHFTDQDHDPETGLDHFLYRQYSPTQGRWMTPDPGGLGVVDPTNPQSWNRYAYVMNNPINLIDLVGLECYSMPNGSVVCHVNDSGSGEPTGIDVVVVTVGGSAPTQGGNSGGSGGGGGAANNGFTLGVRQPGQTYTQCLSANKNTYSVGGAVELTVNVATGTNSNISEKTNFVTGNGVTNLFFDGPGAGDFFTAASHGAGSALTVGRRTSDIMALNLAGKGGLPQALASTGAKGFLESAGKFLNLGLDEATKFAVDAGLAGAEAINCAIPAGNVVP